MAKRLHLKVGDWIVRKDADPEKLLLEVESIDDLNEQHRPIIARITRSPDPSERGVCAMMTWDEVFSEYRIIGITDEEIAEARSRLDTALHNKFVLPPTIAHDLPELTLVRVSDLKILLRDSAKD